MDREIRPGEPSFHRAIQEALERASCVLVLWSVHSVESRYVEVEVSFGWDRGMLVPVLIEEIAGRVPIAFRTVQAANLTAPQAEGTADLTGTWIDRDNDAVYHLRQDGDRIWWYAASRDGRRWSHVFSGARDENVIKGTRADVPPGATRSSGQLAIRIGPGDTLRVIDDTGGFATTTLVRVR